MSKYLPYGEAKFLTPEEAAWIVEEFTERKGAGLRPDSDHGWYVECDLVIDPEMHSFFASYPPLPAKRKIERKDYSSHTRALVDAYGMNQTVLSSSEKLVGDLNEKINYRLHYLYLKEVLFHGVRLKSISRVVQFRQSPWLRSYILDNNEQRRIYGHDPFAKSFWKLMNNR